MVQLIMIADDLTGALDSAVELKKRASCLCFSK